VIDMKARHDSTSGRCDEDHANDPAAPPADGAPHSLLRWLTAAALVVSLTGATGDLGWLRFQRYQADIAAAQAFDAAQKYAFKLANFDANAIDQLSPTSTMVRRGNSRGGTPNTVSASVGCWSTIR
jgi:hypothetical protein